MPLYNLSLINGTGMVPLLQTVNERLMFGYFGILFLIAFFLITFMSFQRANNDAIRAFSWSATMTAIMTLPLRALPLINDYTLYATWILAAIGIVVVIWTERL